MANLKNTQIDDNLELPQGTTGERPASPQEGQIRYNTDLETAEFYNGENWRPLSGTHPEATGGTVVDTDIGGVPYRIHLFTETGTDTLTVTNPGEAEYLIVAGGGAGGAKSLGSGGGTAGGGGGGAGGVVLGKTTVSSQTYSIVVGAGGPSVGNEGDVVQGTGQNGEDSQAFGLTAIGGGGGGRNGRSGVDGGSGGGSADTSDPAGSALQPSSSSGGFGNTGGVPQTNSSYPRAGGGGAGSAGKDGVAGKAGDGGIGISLNITGSMQFYAGGGGGSWRRGSDISGAARGGLGGGSNGGIQNATQIGAFPGSNDIMPPAQPNTGGGGGGQGGSGRNGLGASSAGGSGIVIVRYPRNSSLDTEPDETRPSFQPFFYARDVRPIISRTGLVLELDAANPLSYRGTGTTWTDLSGAENNGTLINNVGYTSQNFGSLTFNGVDTAIHTTQQVSNAFTGNNSLSFWIYFDSDQLTRNCILHSRASGTSLGTGGGSDGSSSNANINMQTRFTNDLRIHLPSSPSSTSVFLSTPMTFNSYSFVTIQWNEQLSLVEGYVNGILQDVNNNAGIDLSAFRNSANSITAIGNNGGDQAFNGKIAKVLIYNRTLSLQEITQNFNATRSRYGI